MYISCVALRWGSLPARGCGARRPAVSRKDVALSTCRGPTERPAVEAAGAVTGRAFPKTSRHWNRSTATGGLGRSELSILFFPYITTINVHVVLLLLRNNFSNFHFFFLLSVLSVKI